MHTTYCIDFDDYCDNTVYALKYVDEIRDKYVGCKITLFTIPQRTSDKSIALAKERGSDVQLAPHGWRHTRGECLSWNANEAQEKIEMAAARGIDAPVFRAPGWLLDEDVYEACIALGYTVASHNMYRIPNTEAREYIYNRKSQGRVSLHGHLTDCGFNHIADMCKEETFTDLHNPVFRHPQELATLGGGLELCVS